MQIMSKGRVALMVITSAFALGALSPAPAVAQNAYTHHHHRYYHYTRSENERSFGPTSPGVSSAMIDVRSGQLIALHGADIPRYPASLTKLMTLDLAFRALASGRLSLETQIPVSYTASAVEPVKLGLEPGSTISVRNAIMAMTTMSANDAATALGQYLGGGSLARCADLMTARAHELGMTNTRFINPSGLPSPYQVTTAQDMATLARDIVLQYPQYQSFFEIRSFDFRGHTIYSNNGMLRFYPGTTGMKTGYTDLARHNLVTSVDRNGRILIGVVLHEPSWGSAYRQMAAMLNVGFDSRSTVRHQTLAQTTDTHTAPGIERVASRMPERARQLPDSTESPRVTRAQWVARLGVYRYEVNARQAAVKAHRLHGRGIAQIEHVEQHGRNLWLAQLAGLTYTGAQNTCREMHAHEGLCAVQRLNSDNLAMLSRSVHRA